MRHKGTLVRSLLVSTLLISLLFSSIGIVPVSAQSNEETEKTVKCLKNREGDIGNSQSLTWHDPPSPTSLHKKLYGEFVTGSTVYTVACRGSGTGRVCSTGDDALDAELFSGGTDLQAGGDKINVKFNNPKQEVDVTGRIEVDADVGGTTANTGEYSFFGVEVRKKVDMNITGQGALQQAMFDFAQQNGKDCAKIAWTHHDPYGILFDSMSLEPLGNVVVTIHDEAGVPLENNPVLRNGKSTAEDGVYNYLVPPGKYKLTFQVPQGYEFIDAPPSHPNMMAIYDFIDENEAKSHCTLYKPNEIIDEKANVPECRNVPLHPVSATPLSKDVSSIEYSFIKNDDGDAYVIKGKVSHPLANVTAFQVLGNQKVTLTTTESNHSGYYSLTIPVEKILPDSPVEVEFKKSVLMNPPAQAGVIWKSIIEFARSLLVKDVQASTQLRLTLDPLPAYIEGYAVDEAQQIIPSATVQVKLKNGGGVYYEAKADPNGYFFIPAKNLPTASLNLEFYLNFVKPNGQKVPYKIYEFTQANRYYFTKENINLLAGTKNGAVPIPQAPEKTKLEISKVDSGSGLKKNSGLSSPRSDSQTPENPAAVQASPIAGVTGQIVMLVMFIIVLMIGAGAAVFFFMKKQQQIT
jgi:hypothetical protein